LQRAWRATDPGLARKAAARYRGDLLPEDLFEEWVVHRRTDLRVSYLALLAREAQLAEEQGDVPAAIAVTQRLLAAEPLDEAAHTNLMRLYAQLGAYPQALAQFDALAALLATELDTEPDTSAVALRDDIHALAQANASRPLNTATPPEPTPVSRSEDAPTIPDPDPDLLGRERELAELARLLARHRLLTLVGPAGAGKTRIAAAAIATELARGRDAHFVELGAIADPGLLPHAIATVIDAATPEVETTWPALMTHIGASSLLLVLDNFEQLIQSAGLVADLLRACPHLSLLVTSRERLRLRAEHVYPVEPLALPDATPAPDDDLTSYPSVRLFLRRAESADPTFAPTSADVVASAEVCRRLDGLPLAIELAAARVRLLPPAALLAHLAQPLSLLTGGPRDAPARQQTMRAAIAWSVDLLPTDTRRAFQRLGVFPGSFSLQAAATVATPTGSDADEADLAALDVLEDLFDKHLLRRITADPAHPRFTMLTVIREYAAELLAQAGEALATRERHAGFYQALAATQAPRLTTAEVGDALAVLEQEAPNLRAALGTRLQAGDGVNLLRVGATLWRYWWLSGHLTEGRAWLARALATADEAASAARAAVLDADGVLAFAQGDFTAARDRHLAALQMARQVADERLAANALLNLGAVADEQGLPHQAARYLDEALRASRASGDQHAVAVALANLGQVAMSLADYPRAAALLNESALAFRDIGDPRSEAAILANLGLMTLMDGDPAAARQCHADALRIFQEIGDTPGEAAELLNLGHASQHLGDRD
ncbi:MAG: tetratricopeptide repeat protein, partial [Thermomicrobiales bacterium]|nr:tetratricopeptide repeat protein [Thermomicrobiales bacterium]